MIMIMTAFCRNSNVTEASDDDKDGGRYCVNGWLDDNSTNYYYYYYYYHYYHHHCCCYYYYDNIWKLSYVQMESKEHHN